jgi:hypothetical protein
MTRLYSSLTPRTLCIMGTVIASIFGSWLLVLDPTQYVFVHWTCLPFALLGIIMCVSGFDKREQLRLEEVRRKRESEGST